MVLYNILYKFVESPTVPYILELFPVVGFVLVISRGVEDDVDEGKER